MIVREAINISGRSYDACIKSHYRQFIRTEGLELRSSSGDAISADRRSSNIYFYPRNPQLSEKSRQIYTTHIQKKTAVKKTAASGESAGARTRDPNIKSVVLYLLSYGFSEC